MSINIRNNYDRQHLHLSSTAMKSNVHTAELGKVIGQQMQTWMLTLTSWLKYEEIIILEKLWSGCFKSIAILRISFLPAVADFDYCAII